MTQRVEMPIDAVAGLRVQHVSRRNTDVPRRNRTGVSQRARVLPWLLSHEQRVHCKLHTNQKQQLKVNTQQLARRTVAQCRQAHLVVNWNRFSVAVLHRFGVPQPLQQRRRRRHAANRLGATAQKVFHVGRFVRAFGALVLLEVGNLRSRGGFRAPNTARALPETALDKTRRGSCRCAWPTQHQTRQSAKSRGRRRCKTPQRQSGACRQNPKTTQRTTKRAHLFVFGGAHKTRVEIKLDFAHIAARCTSAGRHRVVVAQPATRR